MKTAPKTRAIPNQPVNPGTLGRIYRKDRQERNGDGISSAGTLRVLGDRITALSDRELGGLWMTLRRVTQEAQREMCRRLCRSTEVEP